jgi:hypothetical protein
MRINEAVDALDLPLVRLRLPAFPSRQGGRVDAEEGRQARLSSPCPAPVRPDPFAKRARFGQGRVPEEPERGRHVP